MRIGKVLLLACALASSSAIAQVGEQGLLWRAGDPFVFCRYGLDKTPKAWFTMPNYATSVPGITPLYCPFPTPNCGPYMIGWNQTEILSYFSYLNICPRAENSGRWEGSGDGTKSPFKH